MFTFKVAGFKELEDALRQLPEEIAGKVLRQALRTAATPMAEDAASRAPRSDDPGPYGHMADSIKVRLLKAAGGITDRLEEGDAREATGVGGEDLEVHLWIGPDRKHFYGFFGEFGTVHQSERPFMRPAFDRNAEGVISTLQVALWKGIERAAKKLAKTT